MSEGNRLRVDGAGRTDAGVHARGQVIAFTYEGRLTRQKLGQALAALLPADIGVGPLRTVDLGFKPRYRAEGREYRYFIWNGPPSPLQERYALGIRERLDTAAMADAASVFIGRHDFSAFGGADRQPRRTLHEVKVTRSGSMITVKVIGDAFLRGMVRRMVAALVRVGSGKASKEQIAVELAAGPKPAFAGEAAPAQGLILWQVPMRWNIEEEENRQEPEEANESDEDIHTASE